MVRAALAIFAVAASSFAARAEACMPGCSGYHLTFTGPTGAGALADQSVTVTWQDTVDGPSATFDLMVSDQPVPVYPMHSFPDALPGEILSLGISATAQSSFTWDTSALSAGTYFLYAVFHNPPFNTLVMPFAAVAVAHGTPTVSTAALIKSPRGVNAVEGQVAIDFDSVAAPGASASLYVGSPPAAADGTLVATVPVGVDQTATWDSTTVAPGSYVFKLLVTDPNGATLATVYSPGEVQIDGPSSPCATGGRSAGWLGLLGLMALRRRAQGAK